MCTYKEERSRKKSPQRAEFIIFWLMSEKNRIREKEQKGEEGKERKRKEAEGRRRGAGWRGKGRDGVRHSCLLA